MKSKTRTCRRQLTTVEENHPLFSRLGGVLTFKKQLQEIAPCRYLTTFEQSLPQKRLNELDTDRKQTTGMAYANMLPPR